MRIKGAEKKRREIREAFIGDTQKRVFLVEGESDQFAFSQMLDKKFGVEWEKSWVIAPAGGKPILLGVLSKEPDWIGLVDQDEWTEETIAKKETEFPNLHILPRFCLENYMIQPTEIWKSLPEKQKERIPDGLDSLKADILVDQRKWVRHGVLKIIVTPLWDGLIARGFQKDLLNFENAQDDGAIKTILDKWHSFLDPPNLLDEFRTKLREAESKSETEQLTRYIDGKTFFTAQVHPVLNRLLDQQTLEERRNQLFSGLPLPADLEFLWEKFKFDVQS